MTLTKKQEKVKKILLMPINIIKRKSEICSDKDLIGTGQKYYTKFDEDMSDFSVGFYEILYGDILNKKNIGSLLNNKYLNNKAFVGDTMNSLNTVAKNVSADKRDDWKNSYHCLANFWLLPMPVGRKYGKLTKQSIAKDYMDIFLLFLKNNWNDFNEFIYVYKYRKITKYKINYREYFDCFQGDTVEEKFDDFCKKHYIDDIYLDCNGKGLLSDKDNSDKIDYMQEALKIRATKIALSNKCDDLYEYFKKHNLVEK